MIQLPTQAKIVEKKGNWAKFEIEGLWPGYGVTIGNSLRRVLLSSLEGGAVTQMKIRGVSHEFSTITGVLEDTTTIMMNLKEMRFKLFTDEPQKATLKVKGEKEVKGKDFQIPSQIELINPNCHIATLTSKSSNLDMEITIEKGVGYLARERRSKKKTEIGVIPVDAIFTPIKNVAFEIENMRVGERTDFDRLFIEIETDGTISPDEAFSQASEILITHFTFLAGNFKKHEEKKKGKKTE